MVASRGRGAEHDCIDPATGKPGSPFGQSVCLGTKWADDYFTRVWQFIDQTGFTGITVDGPYHGCPCASTAHAHHRGLTDSQWVQWQCQKKMFEEEQRRGMSAGAPDWYFWNGQSATSLGFREASANLPRELGLLLYRQYIYDGTWFKPPTMGGMGIGLIGTYTDDPRARLEPLDQNLDWYELNLIQLLGSGCQANLRANRLYDTERTQKMLRRWVDWYKRHRAILSSDIIHVQRPDGRDIDCVLHVNPQLKEKGLVLFFNPLAETLTGKVRLPLSYTGLSDTAWLREQQKVLTVSGGSGTAVLYGAYAFAEKLGVRFYLHGDVVPDAKAAFALPELNETNQPLFPLRGLQPFHDFPEGPDWWTLDNWKAVVSQAAKMRMNFIGLHTYPFQNKDLGPEPTVWIGLPEDVEADGTVKRSDVTTWYNTQKLQPYGCYQRAVRTRHLWLGLDHPELPGAGPSAAQRRGLQRHQHVGWQRPGLAELRPAGRPSEVGHSLVRG